MDNAADVVVGDDAQSFNGFQALFHRLNVGVELLFKVGQSCQTVVSQDLKGRRFSSKLVAKGLEVLARSRAKIKRREGDPR